MALAYSYIRFSTEKQQLGDSLRRQVEKAERYAQLHGLTLDHQSYRDLGVSAFHGNNAAEGKLGAFLTAVEQGLIPKGSTLLIEDFDRLSRNEIDEALLLFLQIIHAGITIVTLKDDQKYDKEAIRKNNASLMASIIYMGRAHDESAMKSQRVKQAWDQKRKTAKIITSMAPAWLKPSEDRTGWIVDEYKANVVREIFRLAIDGNGTPTIARILNQKQIPTMKSAAMWSFGTVAAILKNSAVVGIYTPKKAISSPISEYFPKIVTDAEFAIAQEVMRQRRWVGGRSRERVTNLFTGYSFCYECKSLMRVVGSNNKHIYLKCLNSYSKGGCTEGRFPYLAAERAILRHLADDLSEFIAQNSKLNEEPSDPRIELQNKKNALEAKVKNLVDSLSEVRSPILVDRINELQEQIQKIEQSMLKMVPPSERIRSVTEVAELFDQLKWEAGNEIPRETRLKLQTELRKIIREVHFWPDVAGKRPGVIVFYQENFGGAESFHDVRTYMEKVGGNRRKINPAKKDQKQSTN